MPVEFSEEQVHKYKKSSISGTGYLAFRDLEKICESCNIDLTKVLDLGCGSGRSTDFLKKFCKEIYGCDISKDALALMNKNHKDIQSFFNKPSSKIYENSPYTSIFSILMFFHFSSLQEIRAELKKCYSSLEMNGSLLIVNGTLNLYTKNYCSVKGIARLPEKSGDEAYIHLKAIDCEVKDFFWSEKTIIEEAKRCGFKHVKTHYPLGEKKDQQEYVDEYEYPPYNYLIFRKA